MVSKPAPAPGSRSPPPGAPDCGNQKAGRGNRKMECGRRGLGLGGPMTRGPLRGRGREAWRNGNRWEGKRAERWEKRWGEQWEELRWEERRWEKEEEQQNGRCNRKGGNNREVGREGRKKGSGRVAGRDWNLEQRDCGKKKKVFPPTRPCGRLHSGLPGSHFERLEATGGQRGEEQLGVVNFGGPNWDQGRQEGSRNPRESGQDSRGGGAGHLARGQGKMEHPAPGWFGGMPPSGSRAWPWECGRGY